MGTMGTVDIQNIDYSLGKWSLSARRQNIRKPSNFMLISENLVFYNFWSINSISKKLVNNCRELTTLRKIP